MSEEKSRVEKLIGFLYASLQELCGICLLVFENTGNKVFDINSEYIKRITKFWGEIYSENCQLFESFTDFNLHSWISRNRFFCASQRAQ